MIIAACAPTLRPVFRKLITGAKRSTARNTSRLRSTEEFKLTAQSGSTKLASKVNSKDPEAGNSEEDLNNSPQGIWLSTEVIVESDAETSSIFYEEPH